MTREIVEIGLDRLRAHPLNSNVMAEELVEKLAGHLGRSGRYPPLVVRRVGRDCKLEIGEGNTARGARADAGAPSPGSRTGHPLPGGEGFGESAIYEVLDGHHRWKALARLGRSRAACVVWDVDDAEALLLLSTLNRLQGKDDPRKRAALLSDLADRMGRVAGELSKWLPENAEQVRKHLEVRRARVPGPVEPRGLGELPVSVHFFLSGAQRDRLETRLKAIGGTREAALMSLVEGKGEDQPRRA